ncbi:MAG: hypothetical protein ACI379_16395 [Nocardioides sp.]|uniref:hypothetical protein n=1 Tax=Nocardioides sp. TaxID=35761 RepID=UPI003F08E2D4
MEHTSPTSRRTVVRAAAWSVPAVGAVSAAPAFAATTPFVPETGAFLMATGAVSGASRDTFTVTSTGVADPITLTVRVAELLNTAALGAYEGANRNFDVVPIDEAGAAAPQNGLLLQFHHTGDYTYQTRYSLQFSRPVTSLRFRVAGLSSYRIQEAVEMRPALAAAGSGVAVSDYGTSTMLVSRWEYQSAGLPSDPVCQTVLTGGSTYSSLRLDAWRAGGWGAVADSTFEAYLGDISFTTVGP